MSYVQTKPIIKVIEKEHSSPVKFQGFVIWIDYDIGKPIWIFQLQRWCIVIFQFETLCETKYVL